MNMYMYVCMYVCMYSHRDTGIVDIEEFETLKVGEVLTLD